MILENDVVIVAYGRSSIAKAGKRSYLRYVHPVDWGADVLRGVLDRVPELDPGSIEDVIVGCAKPERQQGMNIGRLVAQRARLPDAVPGKTVNRFCASGLESISIAANEIRCDQARVLVAGGIESMTCIPMGGDPETRNPWLLEHGDVYISMGITAENVAEEYGVTRQEMDRFSAQSHQKASLAQQNKQFDKEIIPLTVKLEGGTPYRFDRDQGVRSECTPEILSALDPVFRIDGKVTAGNSSQVSDGAAFVVMMSGNEARRRGVRPLARFLGYAVAGVPARLMGIGPIYAVPKIFSHTGLTQADMDVIELNEAFAAQAIPCIRTLGLDPERVNPRGGAIALGHPLGATGTILICKALSYLEDQKKRYGLIAMCIGGGMGAAGIIERIP